MHWHWKLITCANGIVNKMRWNYWIYTILRRNMSEWIRMTWWMRQYEIIYVASKDVCRFYACDQLKTKKKKKKKLHVLLAVSSSSSISSPNKDNNKCGKFSFSLCFARLLVHYSWHCEWMSRNIFAVCVHVVCVREWEISMDKIEMNSQTCHVNSNDFICNIKNMYA